MTDKQPKLKTVKVTDKAHLEAKIAAVKSGKPLADWLSELILKITGGEKDKQNKQ